jgi:hypothetical protein
MKNRFMENYNTENVYGQTNSAYETTKGVGKLKGLGKLVAIGTLIASAVAMSGCDELFGPAPGPAPAIRFIPLPLGPYHNHHRR